jgi:CheY-like chemotaxis protein
MNGKINVTSHLNKGSTFEVIFKSIPIANEETTPPISLSSVDDVQFQQARILIIDTVGINREILKGYLTSYHFILFEATSGREVLLLLEQADDTQHPDVIIIDIDMRHQWGYQILEKIQILPNYKNIPIIAQTVSAKALKKKHSFTEILLKPVSKQDIVKSLMKIIPYTLNTRDEMIKNSLCEEFHAVELSAACIQQLNQLMLEYEHITTYLSMPDVDELGQKVIKIADIYQITPLTNYGQQLIMAADNYDIEKIMQLLQNFKILLKTLSD